MRSTLFGRITVGVAIAFAAVAAITWLVAVNRLIDDKVDETFRPTEGTLLDGRFEVPPGEILTVRLAFNRPTRLAGTFRSEDLSRRISCLVLPEEEFEKWKSGLEYRRLAETGPVPGGRVDRVVEAGIYLLVFDNRAAASPATFSANFSAGRR